MPPVITMNNILRSIHLQIFTVRPGRLGDNFVHLSKGGRDPKSLLEGELWNPSILSNRRICEKTDGHLPQGNRFIENVQVPWVEYVIA